MRWRFSLCVSVANLLDSNWKRGSQPQLLRDHSSTLRKIIQVPVVVLRAKPGCGYRGQQGRTRSLAVVTRVMPSSSSLLPEVGTTRPAAETASSLNAPEADEDGLQAPPPQQQRHSKRARRSAARLISSEGSSDSEGDSWTRWEGLR